MYTQLGLWRVVHEHRAPVFHMTVWGSYHPCRGVYTVAESYSGYVFSFWGAA